VNLKSNLLLGASCIAGIATVGSVFELSSGHPEYGTLPTSIILGLSIPLMLICFYAAVREARANM
jgi:hypothetical protein